MPPAPPLSPLSAAILTALLPGTLHGYGIIKAVARDSAGALRPGAGSLYAALDRMRAAGLIDEQRVSDAHRTFAITGAGRAALRAELQRVERMARIAAEHGLSSEGA